MSNETLKFTFKGPRSIAYGVFTTTPRPLGSVVTYSPDINAAPRPRFIPQLGAGNCAVSAGATSSAAASSPQTASSATAASSTTSSWANTGGITARTMKSRDKTK